jgi:hypothetical protein
MDAANEDAIIRVSYRVLIPAFLGALKITPPKLALQFGGKANPVDKFVVRKSAMFQGQDHKLWPELAIRESAVMSFLWNGFAYMAPAALRELDAALAKSPGHPDHATKHADAKSKKKDRVAHEAAVAEHEAIINLLRGSICGELGRHSSAVPFLEAVEFRRHQCAGENWVLPFARCVLNRLSCFYSYQIWAVQLRARARIRGTRRVFK